jgi:hypothetical protein
MDWFGWRLSKRPTVGPQAILQYLDRRVPRYLNDADEEKLIYPACKRKPSDADGDVRFIWDHTRLEAIRYVTMVPRREFRLLADPSRQTEMLDVYLRQLPHDDTVIEFTGSIMSNLAIAVVAGFNWLNHCATLVEVDRQKFSGTLSNFRKITFIAQQWWAGGCRCAVKPDAAERGEAAADAVFDLGRIHAACKGNCVSGVLRIPYRSSDRKAPQGSQPGICRAPHRAKFRPRRTHANHGQFRKRPRPRGSNLLGIEAVDCPSQQLIRWNCPFKIPARPAHAFLAKLTGNISRSPCAPLLQAYTLASTRQ